MKKIFTGFLVLIIFFSCKKDNQCDCLKSTGEVTTEVREIAPFSSIVLKHNINLFIKQDSVFSCIVEAGENLLPEIITKVEDGKLTISNENKCNWVRSFKKEINVYLTFRNLNLFEYRGSGNIYCADTLFLDSLRFDSWDGSGKANFLLHTKSSQFNLHTGPADLDVSGFSGVNYLYSAGNGKADLVNLNTGYTFLTSKSTNNTFVYATKELFVWIDYIGDVYYKGSPYLIDEKYTGSGKLLPLN